jgi:putative transposase
VKYAFIREHISEFRLIAMCRVLRVHRSGYYAWRRAPQGERSREDARLLGLVNHHWLASGGVYGHRKVTIDLRQMGEACSRHRVLRLMQTQGLRAQIGYGSKPRHRGGPVGQVANTWTASSLLMHRTKRGPRISPTSGHTRAGRIWRL